MTLCNSMMRLQWKFSEMIWKLCEEDKPSFNAMNKSCSPFIVNVNGYY